MKKGEKSQCHNNIKNLLKNKEIAKKHYGFGLFVGGGWRNHSWGSLENGDIVETT